MSDAQQTERYSDIAIFLHWASTVLIIGVWIAGFVMTNVVPEDSGIRAGMYQSHAMFGLLILLLTLGRVIYAFFDKRPNAPAGVEGVKKLLFVGVHWALILALFAMTITGLGMLAFSGMTAFTVVPGEIVDSAPRTGHSVLSKLFLVLLVAHIVGVVRYQLVNGDVMGRMGVNLGGGSAATEN